MFQTEFPFELPKGFIDPQGQVHKIGVMRLATAADEIFPLRDPRVTSPEDPYLTVIILSRVVKKLGTLELINPKVIEDMHVEDLKALLTLYQTINGELTECQTSQCPHCGKSFLTHDHPPGE